MVLNMPKLKIEKGEIAGFADEKLIKVTESARKKIKALIDKEEQNVALRIDVAGGGCNGLHYEMEFDFQVRPRDLVIDINITYLLIDLQSALYLKGTTLDYSNKMIAGGFKFSNPNAKASCSCGDSFSL